MVVFSHFSQVLTGVRAVGIQFFRIRCLRARVCSLTYRMNGTNVSGYVSLFFSCIYSARADPLWHAARAYCCRTGRGAHTRALA